ncbi:MAG: hypothetical protein AVDCRST_MAG02-1594, partial [uncultured Rubrobacteraceae bacterium]
GDGGLRSESAPPRGRAGVRLAGDPPVGPAGPARGGDGAGHLFLSGGGGPGPPRRKPAFRRRPVDRAFRGTVQRLRGTRLALYARGQHPPALRADQAPGGGARGRRNVCRGRARGLADEAGSVPAPEKEARPRV